MSVLLRCFLLLLASAPALAADEPVRLTPEQATRSGIVSAALADMKAGAGIRLPAQVVVPPAQIEVIAAPLPAMVAALGAAYGETVKKGQWLVRLQGAQVLELQRDFANAQAQANLAGESLRRDESLYADGIIAQGRLSATRAVAQQAALLLAERRQALRLAGAAEPGTGSAALSGKTEVRAPFDGVVLEASVQPGSRVDSMTPLFKLGRLAPLWLEIQAAPAQAGGIRRGDAVSIPGCTQAGRVVLVAPQLQAASQSLLIRAELPKPDGCIRPFQYVQAEIASARQLADKTWRVPSSALVRHQGEVWVFLEAPGGFRPVAVKVLDETPDTTLVAADLAAESRLAVKGVSTLKAKWLGLGGGQ
ncbi:MAG: efflux RND transporter periplasmic adaptor subunit [Sulfuritalea sp.]